MPVAEDVEAVLDSWVGTTENPPGSDNVFICEEFGPVGDVPFYAWCVATLWVACHRVGLEVPKTASVGHMRAAAQRGDGGLQWFGPDADTVKGMWSCFDFKGNGDWRDFHISFVKDPGTQAKFRTLGGNERDALRDQWRDRTHLMGLILPPYDGVSTNAAGQFNGSPNGGLDQIGKLLMPLISFPNHPRNDERAVRIAQTIVDVPVDGVFGNDPEPLGTAWGVAAFQESQGLPVDGEVGPRTWTAMLQWQLGQTAGFPLPVTGVYDEPTTGAVIAFQQQRGLEVDGDAGMETFGTLTGQ